MRPLRVFRSRSPVSPRRSPHPDTVTIHMVSAISDPQSLQVSRSLLSVNLVLLIFSAPQRDKNLSVPHFAQRPSRVPFRRNVISWSRIFRHVLHRARCLLVKEFTSGEIVGRGPVRHALLEVYKKVEVLSIVQHRLVIRFPDRHSRGACGATPQIEVFLVAELSDVIIAAGSLAVGAGYGSTG